MRFRLGRRRRSSSVAALLLETIPPVFHVALLSLLTYFYFSLRPDDHYHRLAAVFVVFQILSNWVMFVLNKSVVGVSPKNFPGYIHRYPSLSYSREEPANISAPPEFERYLWKECETCDLHVPQRTHHCGHCRRCVYILDHHCYFLGTCVGRTNMRFFLVFCTYAALGSALGVNNLFQAMGYYRNIWSQEAVYYLLPYTVVMYMMKSAAAFEILYVGLINFGVGACLACLYLLAVGFYSVFTGETPHEEKKKKHQLIVRLDDPDEDLGWSEHFTQVFGSCGWLHFLVPIVPFEGPQSVLGYRRIITYNNDYVLDGTVFTSETDLDFEES